MTDTTTSGLPATDPGWRSPSVLATLVVVLVGIVLTIGSPIVGGEVLAGTDALENFDPWRTTAPDLGPPDNPLRGDEIDVALPARRDMREGVLDGEVPLWQSTVNGGRPLAPLPNTGSVTPFDWPYFVLPMSVAPGWSKVVEIVVAIAAMVALLRRWGVRRDVALLAGFLVSMTGFQIAWTGWSQAHLGALVPAMIWATDRAVRERRLADGLPLAGVVMVAWLEGFPAVTLFGLTAAGVYALLVLPRPWRLPLVARRLGRAAGAVVLGTGLAAFQLVPFLHWFRRLDTSSRVQTTGDDLPLSTLLTAVFPDAFGDVASWRAALNYVEVQAFAGVVVVALAGAALWVRVPDRHRTPRQFLVGICTTTLLLAYVGGPFLAVAQATPLFRLNDVSRLRVLLGFALVALAALALDRWLRAQDGPAGGPTDPWRWPRVGGGALAATAVLVVGLRASLAGADQTARRALRTDVVVGLGVMVVVIAVGVLVHRRRTLSWLAVPVLGVVALVEVVGVTTTVLPRSPDEAFYPRTPDHDIVAELAGDDRSASGGLALYPGTTAWYGIRTVAGHAFPTPEWRAALEAVDPEVYRRLSSTLPVLGTGVEVATSPILDRLAARVFVNDLAVPLYGRSVPAPTVTGALVLAPGARWHVDVSVDDPVRGLTLEVLDVPGGGARTVVLRAVDASGTVLAEGTRRWLDLGEGGTVEVGVPEVDAPVAALQIDVEEGPIEVAAAGEVPAVGLRLAEDDGLRLAGAAGTVVWERLDALPRHRWASRAEVEPDAAARLGRIARGEVPGDTVLLHEGDDQARASEGLPAAVEVVTPDGDRVEVRVDAEGAGHLVVADSMQRDWSATVDGESVALLAADHVGVAVPVPAGEHVVVLTYRPAGWHLGLGITAASALLVISIVIGGRRQRARDTGRGSAA